MTLVPLLRLYPRAWRRRYGDEMAFVVSAERPTLRLAADLIAGAVDARLNPRWTPRLSTHNEEGVTMANFLAHCQPVGVSREDHIKSAGVMLGGTLALTILYLVLKSNYGASPFIDAFGFALFPSSLALSARYTYLKRYSSAAASVLTVGTIIIIFGIMLLATLVSERI
jgi:hypothetical protein